MRVPSGDAPAPCPASMSLISPTTLLVAGSMMWTLSPALLVWMIRTLLCAASGSAPRITTLSTRTKVRERVLITPHSSHRLLGLPHDEGPQHLPLGILLRGEVLPAAVEEVAACRLFERVNQQRALRVSGQRDAPYGFEVLLRLLFREARSTGRRRLQSQRRSRPVARDAPGVAATLGDED